MTATGAHGGYLSPETPPGHKYRALGLRPGPRKGPRVPALRASIPAPTSTAWPLLRSHHHPQTTLMAAPSADTGLRGQRPTGGRLPGEGKLPLVAATSCNTVCQWGGRQRSCQPVRWHEKFRPVYTFVCS